VREISGARLRIGPIEAIDGTPVVDIKPVLADSADH
jgi:tRNA (Thr-GGU) A37 N-methylase